MSSTISDASNRSTISVERRYDATDEFLKSQKKLVWQHRLRFHNQAILVVQSDDLMIDVDLFEDREPFWDVGRH